MKYSPFSECRVALLGTFRCCDPLGTNYALLRVLVPFRIHHLNKQAFLWLCELSLNKIIFHFKRGLGRFQR